MVCPVKRKWNGLDGGLKVAVIPERRTGVGRTAPSSPTRRSKSESVLILFFSGISSFTFAVEPKK